MGKSPFIIGPYLILIFAILFLSWSIWAMVSAINYQRQGDQGAFVFWTIIGLLGIALSISTVLQTRKRLALLYAVAPKIVSVEVCRSCGLKVVRPFSAGDYILKTSGSCRQCGSQTWIEQIYAEEVKRFRA